MALARLVSSLVDTTCAAGRRVQRGLERFSSLIFLFELYVSSNFKIEMTEGKVEKVPEAAKELLALNPKQESAFKQKVQEAKKNKSKKKVGKDKSCERAVLI